MLLKVLTISAISLLTLLPTVGLAQTTLAATPQTSIKSPATTSKLEDYQMMKRFVTGYDEFGAKRTYNLGWYFKFYQKENKKKFFSAKLPKASVLAKMPKDEVLNWVAFGIGDPVKKLNALRIAYGIKDGDFYFQSDTQQMLRQITIAGRAGDIAWKRPNTGGPETAIAAVLREEFGLDIFIASKN
jgi:hypothetical protein